MNLHLTGHGQKALNEKPDWDPTTAPVKLMITNPRKSSTIQPGQTLSVSLEAEEGESFMGFIIQARDTQTDKQVGTWTFDGDDIRTMSCNKGNIHVVWVSVMTVVEFHIEAGNIQ